jgi:hypothetical protein
VAPQPPSRDHVVVVRVHLRDPAADLLIVDLLEVGRDSGADRQIGRATDPTAAAQLLRDWLLELVRGARTAAHLEDPGDGGEMIP